MIIRKMFLSFIGEKRWLEKMNRDGYEPTRVTPYTYEFEKTDKSVVFEYVFLKNGKKSFDALDYKQKDADAKAVYANAEVALFKKPADKGAFTILTESQKKVNLLRKRSSLYTECLIFLAVTMTKTGHQRFMPEKTGLDGKRLKSTRFIIRSGKTTHT